MPNYLQDTGKITLGSEIYIVHGGKVLMHKRSETKKNFPGFWIQPGGHIDENEDALTAAIREAKEETGITVKEEEIALKAVAFHNHLDRRELFVLHMFRADLKEYQLPQGATAEGTSRWIPLDELAAMGNIFPPAKYYFDHILGNRQGILYTNIQWEKSQLVKVVSRQVEK